MAGKKTGKTSGCAVIEEDQHPSVDLLVDGGLFERTRHKRHEAVQLFTRHWKLLDHFLNAYTGFEILKQNLHRGTGSAQPPRATDFAGDALHGGTLRPIETRHSRLFLRSG